MLHQPRPALPSLPPLALSMSSAAGLGGTVREALERAQEIGFRAVVLDGAAPGGRARDLDRSARRDLASLLRRLDLEFAGVELAIPSSHFADAGKSERAVEATGGALELAADLARFHPPSRGRARAAVWVTLPSEGADRAIEEIERRAALAGAVAADFGPAGARGSPVSAHVLVGLDGAASGRTPEDVAAKIGRVREADIGAARLSNWPVAGAGAAPDALAFAGSLTAIGFQRPIGLDVRGQGDVGAAAGRALKAWGALLPSV